MKITWSLLLLAAILSSCAPKEKISEIDYSTLEPGYKIADSGDNIVLNNQEDLVKLKSTAVDVDLKKQTIFGIKGSIGGCKDPDIEMKVIRDDSKKLYTVETIVKQNGLCKKLILYQKFIAIDKMKKSYEVSFVTNEILENGDSLFQQNGK